jgi:exonuclease III
MKICCWNIRRASSDSEATWDYLAEINPDIALLQEVGSISPKIEQQYKSCWVPARTKEGRMQKFGTAVLLRGDILAPIKLATEWPWANELLDRFGGNLVGLQVDCGTTKKLNVVSVYSPAWPIPTEEWEGQDVSEVKSEYSSGDVWLADLLLSALRNEDLLGQDWILGGDLNSSITFDYLWGNEPRGNLAYLERMEALGLLELLRHHQGQLTPTFRNPKGGKIIHQIDHLFASPSIQARLKSCDVGDKERIFAEASLSDHLPIIAEFE